MSQVILFDLDGTLTQSGEGITKCVQYALEKMGIVENDLKNLESFIGPPLKDSFMKYGGLTEEQAILAIAYYRERYETEGIFENRLYPKVSDLLELLQINDKIMGVASSKPEDYVKQILEHFGIASYFKVIVGSEMNGAKVTKTEVIEEALARLQMQTERDKVVMVGDRAEDVYGALNCGIQCVGVLYGYGTEEELKQAGAVYLAEEVEDLAVLASPNDEETTEHVESIRQNDLKEQEVQPIKEEATVNSKEELEISQEEFIGSVSEAESKKDEEMVSEQQSVAAYIMDDDDDDFLEPARPRVKKSKVIQMHPIHHIWRWIYPLALYLIVSVAVSLCTGIYYSITLLLGDKPYSTQMLTDMIVNSSLLQTFIAGAFMAMISWLLYQNDQKKRELGILGKGKEPRWCPVIVWLFVIVISIAGCQLMNDVITMAGLHEMFPTYVDVADQVIYSQPAWLIFVTVGIVAPLAEEFIFRGLLFCRMKDWMKPWLAIILSGLLFGAYHGNVVQFIYAFFMGMIFAIIYHKTGTLWTTVVAHMTANFWSVLGYGYVSKYAQTIEYGTWMVIGVSAFLCIIPTCWLIFHKNNKKVK